MEILIGVVGGLGLFLFGMQIMGAGLQKSAGKRLERIVGLLTKNRFIGVIVGMLVTGVIQSSSATTVMVVGFVNAGIMNLTQAVGVIMGANIGTTITGQIVSLSVDTIAPIFVGIGMILWMTAKKDKQKNLAEIFIGLGILFIGMEFLKDSLKPLRELEQFNTMILTLGKNPILGVLVGLTLTFVVQSSSASIGMLIALASQGVLPLSVALPILYGDNMGTCTTALLSSIGASKNAKRAAIMHMAFNFVGTVLFIVFLAKPITAVVMSWNPTDVGRQIANAHTIFNLANVVIQFPFAFILIKIAMWIVPDRGDEKKVKLTTYIDDRILETPSIAVHSAVQETVAMGRKAMDSLTNTMDSFFDNKVENLSETYVMEKDLNDLEKEITEFLVKLSSCDIMDEDRAYIDGLFNAINDIERVGDHSDNIAELITAIDEYKIQFSDTSRDSLKEMYKIAAQAFTLALNAIEKPDFETIEQVIQLETEMDMLQRETRKDHFTRLHAQECDAESGIYYLDIVNNLERVSDLSLNLAKMVAEVID